MASQRFEKGSPEWNLFQDYWRLCQAFWLPDDSDEYWNGIRKAVDDFYEKHKAVNKFFVKKLAVDFVEAMYKKCK